jgi:hypothetical protein
MVCHIEGRAYTEGARNRVMRIFFNIRGKKLDGRLAKTA